MGATGDARDGRYTVCDITDLNCGGRRCPLATWPRWRVDAGIELHILQELDAKVGVNEEESNKLICYNLGAQRHLPECRGRNIGLYINVSLVCVWIIDGTRVSVIVSNLQFLLELNKWMKSEDNIALRWGSYIRTQHTTHLRTLCGRADWHEDSEVLAWVCWRSWRSRARRALLPLMDRSATHGRRSELLPILRKESQQNVRGCSTFYDWSSTWQMVWVWAVILYGNNGWHTCICMYFHIVCKVYMTR